MRNNEVCFIKSLLLGLGLVAGGMAAAQEAPSVHRLWPHLLDPREHPDYSRRAVKPPTWETFQNQPQFTCLRGFEVKDERIVGYAQEIDKFTRAHELGTVIWPSYPILFATNLGELAGEIKQRGLYLFDVWGYVPGSGSGGYWQQFKVPAEALATLEAKLGERWLGTDIGEQDGRYIGGYANQMTPASASRFDQYLNFQRHFERMGDDLGHRHATLVSLNFGHYFLKEGTYTMIGAETAQALPNSQVYYAFIRGAGKQYGVPWFGNASIFNRWGFKSYPNAGSSDGYAFGPTKGTSLSLLKRLLYSHLCYNCVAVGFENGWFDGEQLSPIGRIQQAAQRWVKEHGPPGIMHTPVALLLDFYSGWTFPRHLYSENIYRVWGNLPYSPGDYLTDAVLDLLYPGYQNASYFHDESGFLAPTPYGDIADCLLSDAPGWLLARYPVVVVAGELTGGQEIRDKLHAYVAAGGHLVITAGNLAKLPGGIAGQTNGTTSFTIAAGQGRLTVFASAFGVELKPLSGDTWRSEIDRPLPKPYALDPEVRRTLDELFRQQRLFDAGNPDLSLITCRRIPGEYTVAIANNSWREAPFQITSFIGPIESIHEWTLDPSETNAPGYTPEGVEAPALGHGTARTIAGGDVRFFALRVRETNVLEIAHRAPPPRPRGRVLPLRRASSIKEEILARPTFFENFDGVIVDWRYLHERELAALDQEAGWLQRQGLRVHVDLSSGLNLYPNLRMVDNLAADYAVSLATITNVLDKMPSLAARDLILSLHRHPENNFSDAQSRQGFEKTLRYLADQAAARQVTLHLRQAPGKPPWNLEEARQVLDRVGASNLRLAPSTALLAVSGLDPGLSPFPKDRIGLWLAAGARSDPGGKLWDVHRPLHLCHGLTNLNRWLALARNQTLVLDAVYTSVDEEYRDAAWLRSPAIEPVRLVEVRKIWDQAPHNAFTDLARFDNRWFCVFREGAAHVSPDGALRVLTSADGARWSSAALVTATNADLRDPKICVTPTGELMLSAAGALYPSGRTNHETYAWFSRDGRQWSGPATIGDLDQWLWRITWHQGTAWSIGYDTAGERFIRLYRGSDGRRFEPVVDRLFDREYPNEHALVFPPDHTALCLLRRDGQPGHGLLGTAKAPYTQWEWRDLGRKIGGPHMLRLPDGRLVAAVRLYDGAVRTSLCWVDRDPPALTEVLPLPSGGDCSYAGMVWHDGLLWISYYSSHEGKPSIYLAKVAFP